VALVRRPDGDFTQWLLRAGYRIRDRAIVNCNVDTGRLRSSLQVVMTPEPSVRVGTDVEYARWVHEGRGEVLPVTAQALHWVGPTGEVFTKRSRPYAGNPFLRDALESELRDL
jgi:hypothetical protein